MFEILIGDRSDNHVSISWYLNEEKPEVKLSEITSLAVSGKELQFVTENYKNIVYHTNNKPMVWVGDLARTIYENI